mgnify:FL=1
MLDQLKHDLDETILPDLIDAFLSEARGRVQRIVDGAAGDALPVVAREAHTLKSSAGTFGAVRLADAVRAIERACQAGDGATVQRISAEVPALLEERTDLVPETVEYFVRNGVSVMPAFRKTEIGDEDLAALGAYLARNATE